ncbi:MAG: hypothetical protein K1X78_15380, partial [Verrucomicrobiaceae bacterium]|nr:hypothetical protein [Verrucomicrobiaceae bacterium]
QLESTLTQKNRVPDAKTVREYREALGRAAGPPSAANALPGAKTSKMALAGASAPPVGAVSVADLKGSSWRKAAEWALSLGATLEVRPGTGTTMSVSTVSALPPGKFEITKVDFLNAPADKKALVTDEGIALLAGQKELNLLKLSKASVTDNGLAILANFPHLDVLNLEGCGAVTDGVFAHIKKASKLRTINLSATAATPSSLGLLKQYRHLEELVLDTLNWQPNGYEAVEDLQGLQIFAARSSAALPADILATMKKLPKLYILKLSNSRNPLSDDDFADIASFTRLITLWLPVGLGDATLERIATLPILQELRLSRGAVTDAGLASLKKMKKLTLFSYDVNNKFSEAGLADLQKALPNLKIEKQ